MEPSPKSLILDLLATVGRASAPVRALVAAGELFGIGDNRLRVALARLCSDGLVESDGRGRYRLGRAARGVSDEIRGWRSLERRLRAWDGHWVGVLPERLGRAASRLAQRKRDRALRLLGFRPFGPGLALRPDNLEGGVADVRRRLAALGIEAPGLVFQLGQLDAQAESDARGLWDTRTLSDGYRAARERLAASADALRAMPRGAAMVESFQVGGAVVRQLVLDPLLPDAILPGDERRALARAMHDYDRLGREAWAGWLGASEPRAAGMPFGVRERSPAEASGLAAVGGDRG